MELIHKIETRNIHLDHDLHITGILNGNITIVENGILLLNGTINGNIVVNSGICKIHGIVNGNINNSGGNLEIFGMVNGTLNTQSGQTTVDPNSTISNK